ncbi:MAG: phenylalanine--tRNA ligase subunit beta [Candidatus Brocadiaceae bacterium]
MKITYNWLKEYVYFYLSPNELADRLTRVGLVVASIQPIEDDFCLEIEVTSNRPDCLGIMGIAREVAAAVGGALRLPEANFTAESPDISKLFHTAVDDQFLCPRYTARVIRRVTIGPSPEWMQKRLKCIGLRPVNNVVDVTNYVMMETGQPVHAFDLDKLSDQKVVVRKAMSGEEIVLINGARRALFHDMLVIADGKKPIAVAGIMGGKDTEVTDSTRNILIECAEFEPRQIRRTAKAVGVVSDSSYRFERGTDPEGIDFTSRRTVKLVKDLAGGEIADGVLDIKSRSYETKKVTLRLERLHKILGIEIKKDIAVDILKKLQFTVINSIDNFIDIEVPGFRGDIDREIDLIEEIARIYGYDNVPVKTAISVRSSAKSKFELVEEALREFLVHRGFYEVKTYSIVDVSPLQSVKLWSDKEGIDIANPLRTEESRLRTSLLPSLIGVKRFNTNHGTEEVNIFEIAKVYLRGDKLPQEKTCLSLLADTDFFTLKGIVESLFSSLGMSSRCDWTVFSEPLLFQNERAARIQLGDVTVGYMGESSKNSELRTSPCIAELDMEVLVEKSNFAKKYQTMSPYPAVSRDLAIIVDEAVTWASIEGCISNTKASFLKEIKFFDVFRGKQVPQGKKSIAFNLCFQAQDRTLKSEEVDVVQQLILETLHKFLSAELRK